MATKKQGKMVVGNRQSAYIARNRASLIKAAQVVLAEAGLHATIDQLATSAQVSPTTIYKYFESKEALLSEALDAAWQEWVLWAHAGDTPGASIQTMIDVFRLLIRVEQSHPQFARIVKNTIVDPHFLIESVRTMSEANLRDASIKEGMVLDRFEERAYLFSYALAGILNGVYVTERLSPEQADASLELSLQLLNLSKAKAKKLVSKPLTYPESP